MSHQATARLLQLAEAITPQDMTEWFDTTFTCECGAEAVEEKLCWYLGAFRCADCLRNMLEAEMEDDPANVRAL